MANNRPGTFIWCMGGTQHTNGNNNTRAYCALQLALGNMGVSGGGANIFRGHCNVQGATDFCVLSHSLPGYYGLSAGAWKHWARVWGEDINWLKGRFDSIKGKDGKSKSLMNLKGIPVSRWIDGVLEDKNNMDQPDNLRAMVFWGHAPNSQTRLKEMKTAMEKLELMVVLIHIQQFLLCCLIVQTVCICCLQQRSLRHMGLLQHQTALCSGVKRLSSLHLTRCLITPLSTNLPRSFGFADRMFRQIKVTNDEPLIEDVTREFNSGMWTIGYTGQSPERLKAHMANQHMFDKTTLQAVGGELDGEYYGLPWPCWGTPEMGHPGTPLLYDTSKPVAEGGLCFRARFGVEHEGNNLLAEGSYPVGSEIKDGYPEFTMGMLKKLGWDGDLTAEERSAIEKVAGDKTNWKVDLSGGIQRVAIKHGCAPFGNAKARVKVWTFPDPIPLHREPLYTSRRDWWLTILPTRIGNSIVCRHCTSRFRMSIIRKTIQLS